MIKPEKVEKLNNFANIIKGKSLIFVDYHGIDMENLDNLRVALRKEGSILKVTKNTMAKKTLEKLKIPMDESIFKGMIATAIVDPEQFVNSSKNIFKAEKSKNIVIKGGFFDGKDLSSKEVRKYASLLARDEFYGVLVGCLQGIISNLVYVLDNIKEEKEKSQNGSNSNSKNNPEAKDPKVVLNSSLEKPKVSDEKKG